MARARPRLVREPLLSALTLAAVVETVWTIYIGWRLPRDYVANHWDLAWVGLDATQVVMLLACAWAAWRRRAVLILFASISATLLLVDAWFDVTTARQGDVVVSVIVAGLVEVPSAIALFWVTRRSIRQFNDALFGVGGAGRVRIRRFSLPPTPGQRARDEDQLA